MTASVSSTNPHLSILTTSFQTASADRYLHVVINTKTDPATLLGKPLQDRLTQIKTTEGIDPFTNPIGKRNWTPAHIAAIKGNKAALDLLQKQGAITDAVDTEGHTPRYYAELYHPELLSYFRKPGDKFTISFKGLFPALPSAPANYAANTNDFGVDIRHLLFMKPHKSNKPFNRLDNTTALTMDHFAQNMRTVAKELGFQITFADTFYYPRDVWIRLPSGKICLPNQSHNIPSALQRSDSYTLVHQTTGQHNTDNIFFLARPGASFTHGANVNQDMRRILSLTEDTPCMPFYMDGGDYYCMTTPEGKTKIILTKDLLRIALNQFRLDGVFSESNAFLEDTIRTFVANLQRNPPYANKILHEMYPQGLVPPGEGRQKGVLTRYELGMTMATKQKSMPGHTYAAVATALKFFSPLTLPNTPSKADILAVATYLAQKTVVMALVADAFGVAQDDVVLVQTSHYHLDIGMRPGPNNTMLVQDYALTLEVLRRIETNAKDLELTDADKELLARYIKAAEKLQSQIGPFVEETKTQLREAGIPVISAPAVFYDDANVISYAERPSYNNNFMNAISGWSNKLQKYYYIAAGAKAGDKLGSLLMQSYREFLEQQCPGIRVYYVGYDPKNPTNFTEASNWSSMYEITAGPHCFSFELEVASHNHSS